MIQQRIDSGHEVIRGHTFVPAFQGAHQAFVHQSRHEESGRVHRFAPKEGMKNVPGERFLRFIDQLQKVGQGNPLLAEEAVAGITVYAELNVGGAEGADVIGQGGFVGKGRAGCFFQDADSIDHGVLSLVLGVFI